MSGNDGPRRSAIGALLGFITGAYLGSSLGIAGHGTAISGTIPVGLIGLWLGYHYGDRLLSAIQGNEPTANGRTDNRKTEAPHDVSDIHDAVATFFGKIPDHCWKTFLTLSAAILVFYAMVSRSITTFGIIIVLTVAFFCTKMLHQSDFIDRNRKSAYDPSEKEKSRNQVSNRVIDGSSPSNNCGLNAHAQDEGVLVKNDHMNIKIAALLGCQISLAYTGVDSSDIDDAHEDDWSIGYISGFNDTFFQRAGQKYSIDASNDLLAVFIELYGSIKGPELCARALRLTEEHQVLFSGAAGTFADGSATGEQDAMDWLTSQGGKTPLRWSRYLKRQCQDI